MSYNIGEPDGGWKEVYQWVGVSTTNHENKEESPIVKESDLEKALKIIVYHRRPLKQQYLYPVFRSKKKTKVILEKLKEGGWITFRNGWVRLAPIPSYHEFYINKSMWVMSHV